MRFSYQRQKIREIVHKTNTHPTADWVYLEAKKSIHNISLGTVYRNLKQLEESGDIKTIYDENIARYDWNTEPHNHLKCKNCGDLIDIVLSDKSIYPKIKKDFKFDVDLVEMTIIGTCYKHA
jgi:Fur family ferric uptake transcriptional regulator/Fur family peroxide stress response transcriptional regulator|tara:strand:+ start:361 stop:726 length:366 start_codon:yes stop_codon:yes gene_type:complete